MKRLLAWLIRTLCLIIRKLLACLLSLDQKLNVPLDSTMHKLSVVRSTELHDMEANEDEKYYAEQYWTHIATYLKSLNCSGQGNYLDLGCGQGRISSRLASWCQAEDGQVTGVDLSPLAIEKATLNAKILKLKNLSYMCTTISDYLKCLPDDSVDGILFLEVIFFLPEFKQILKEIIRVLKKEAFLLASFRSQYFNALHTVNNRLWNSVDMLICERSGRLWGGHIHLNWNTSSEINQLFIEEFRLRLHNLIAIGACSGIKGDPLSGLARPSLLRPEERAHLNRLELAIGHTVPDLGRYMLAMLQKTEWSI